MDYPYLWDNYSGFLHWPSSSHWPVYFFVQKVCDHSLCHYFCLCCYDSYAKLYPLIDAMILLDVVLHFLIDGSDIFCQ